MVEMGFGVELGCEVEPLPSSVILGEDLAPILQREADNTYPTMK